MAGSAQRLIPYLRAVAHDAARSGLPVMRAMALAFPGDRAACGFEEQFCLLVAPVLRPRRRGRAMA